MVHEILMAEMVLSIRDLQINFSTGWCLDMSQLFMVLIISCKSQQILKKNTCTGKTKYSYLHVESGVVYP